MTPLTANFRHPWAVVHSSADYRATIARYKEEAEARRLAIALKKLSPDDKVEVIYNQAAG